MTDFKVTESGWYRTRDGGLAECVVADFEMEFPVRGYISNFNPCAWNVYGKSARDKERKYDLVEYLGKERPKEPISVADYLVKVGFGNGIAVWYQYTHPIGSQPEGSVLVPGSEREQE